MRTSTYTELRNNLATLLDRVAEDHDPILITRGSDKQPAVLISLEDYNSFIETMHLMSSATNAKRLDDAINSLRLGKGIQKKLINY
jgi:antitoxin YefM